jgi:hypothetical protein
LLLLGFSVGASAWIYVPDRGDSGWCTYTYTAGPAGFSGIAGFVVSNVMDNFAYSELLLDNLSQGGGGDNRGFEGGNLSGFELLGDGYADVVTWAMAALGTIYNPTQGLFLSDQLGLLPGVDTSSFHNACGQPGTIGTILETGLTLAPGEIFSFDWAFLGNDQSPWNDFALFYLKEQVQGTIVFIGGLAQIGVAPIPIPSSVLLVGTGLLGVLGLARRANRKD